MNYDSTYHILKQWERLQPGTSIITGSAFWHNGLFLAMAHATSPAGEQTRRFLVLATEQGARFPEGFEGTLLQGDGLRFMRCAATAPHAQALREAIPSMRPVPLGTVSTFGFGDRLGNAGAAHLKALADSRPVFLPVLAQQSIRELGRTARQPEEVLDAATWAVLEAGWRRGYGADADHLKTVEQAARMVQAGYTFFTIDPSDYVDNRAGTMSEADLLAAFEELPWGALKDRPEAFRQRYENRLFRLSSTREITLEPEQMLRAAVKYGAVLAHTRHMAEELARQCGTRACELELSVDETPHPTTPAEHLIIASELQRLNVRLVSLAPRFCGHFQKGIDFRGSLDQFADEYLLHQAIAAAFGGYKLSFHSGSDKFSVYERVGALPGGEIHVKTAGTSYLEAVRAIALTEPALFREIARRSVLHFEQDRKTYDISAEASDLEKAQTLADNELATLLDDDMARQVLHVTYGSVLQKHPQPAQGAQSTRATQSGLPGEPAQAGEPAQSLQPGQPAQSSQPGELAQPTLYGPIMQALETHRQTYHRCLYRHFRRHIVPFEGRPAVSGLTNATLEA